MHRLRLCPKSCQAWFATLPGMSLLLKKFLTMLIVSSVEPVPAHRGKGCTPEVQILATKHSIKWLTASPAPCHPSLSPGPGAVESSWGSFQASPVSHRVQPPSSGANGSRQSSISLASFLAIMFRQISTAYVCTVRPHSSTTASMQPCHRGSPLLERAI